MTSRVPQPGGHEQVVRSRRERCVGSHGQRAARVLDGSRCRDEQPPLLDREARMLDRRGGAIDGALGNDRHRLAPARRGDELSLIHRRAEGHTERGLRVRVALRRFHSGHLRQIDEARVRRRLLAVEARAGDARKEHRQYHRIRFHRSSSSSCPSASARASR